MISIKYNIERNRVREQQMVKNNRTGEEIHRTSLPGVGMWDGVQRTLVGESRSFGDDALLKQCMHENIINRIQYFKPQCLNNSGENK